MSIEEIFTSLSSHIVEGMMIHSQMADYYYFLGLKTYACEHDKHYKSESDTHRKISHHYICKYDKLIPESLPKNPGIIPESWFKHMRTDVDPSTKKNAVKNGMNLWYDWECDTAKLYEQLAKDCLSLGDMYAYDLISNVLSDVYEEKECAKNYILKLTAMDYDMAFILEQQKEV